MTRTNIDVVMAAVEGASKVMSDGHLTLMRFTTGWKVMFGTPELSLDAGHLEDPTEGGGGYGKVSRLTSHRTLREALAALLDEVTEHE